MDVNIRVAGEAGQGVATTGSLLVESLARLGLHVLMTSSYMSRIRGGLNWFDIRVSDAPLHGPREDVDLLVALTDAAVEILRATLRPGGLVLRDGAGEEGVIGIDLAEAARQADAPAVAANTVAGGAALGLLGYRIDTLRQYLAEEFGAKGSDIVEANARAAQKGLDLAGPHAGKLSAPRPGAVQGPRRVTSGAEAVGLGAATAGVRVATGYPMTPSTATLQYLAAVADEYGIVVEQAEDEIAAINMVCGAAYAGAAAMTTTSGGGFALMVEGVSLAGMLELPAVVLVAQRPGPATGLPTRTAQGDLLFVCNAGHGEFPRAVFAPGDLRQCYDLTRHAVETAHRFQTPVCILTDQFLQDLTTNIEPLDATRRPVNLHVVENPASQYARYAVTDSGVSPRAVPGGEALVSADSDEHDEHGHIAEDLGNHLAQHDKRMRKGRGLAEAALPPDWYGPDDAPTVLIAWGSSLGPCREAVEAFNARGQRAALMHFSQVWPVNVDAARHRLGRRDRVVCVEGNSTGQFAALLRQVGLLGPVELLTRYDGLAFSAQYIVERLKR